MRNIHILFIALWGVLSSTALLGQTVEVSDPRLELRDGVIHITYDILNSTSSDNFTVELEVKDANGNRISTKVVTGDIGEMVNGGSNRHIAWDYEADRVDVSTDIFVKILVNAVQREDPVPAGPVTAESQEPAGNEKDPESASKRYNRTSLILQSVAFPGLGMSRYKGGPHWIRGVAGYGCIAGSVIMSRSAVNTYNGILDLSDFDEKDELYQKSLQQDQISEVLAYAAIAIWVSDLVWTFVGTSDLGRTASHQRRLHINPGFDPVSSAPLLSFNYRF